MSSVLNCTNHQLKLPNIIEATGAWLFDDKGKKYLDLESGVWCTALGHNNKRINTAIAKQGNLVAHAGFCYSNNIVEQAAKSVLDITGLEGGQCVFLCSGSEAIELARQIAKHLTGKPVTLCLDDAYLGSYSTVIDRQKDWHLFDWRECASCPKVDTCDNNCPKLQAIPDTVSEFVFEPGSGGGYVRFPPNSLINNIIDIVRGNGGKILVNDVTTGMGRTGKWFGYNHFKIKPDLVAIGKGVGNGYPVSVMALSKQTVSQLQDSGFKYTQSHQNDPLGAAVALEVINVMTDENLIARSEKLGRKFLKQLQSLAESRHITEIRGRGMMFGIDFADKEIGDRLYEQLLEKGYIICNRGGTYRLDPPLVIDKNDFSGFVEVFRTLLEQVS